MSVAQILYPIPEASQPAEVVPLNRSHETSAAHWTGALIVLDARIAVAEEHARSLGPSRRSRDVRQCLAALAAVRIRLEELVARVATNERPGAPLRASRTYAAAVCEWCCLVAGALRAIASADDRAAKEVREQAARASSACVRSSLVPLFAELEAECSPQSPVRSLALTLQGDVVLVNWELRG